MGELVNSFVDHSINNVCPQCQKITRLQPEDGDEQIDKHDGCRQNVDIKQYDRDQGAFWAARQSSAVQVESTVVAAVSNVASQRTNISQ